MSGNIGTGSEPVTLRSTVLQLTPLTNDPSSTETGEMWLREDIAPETGQIATLRFDNGAGEVDIPVYSDSTSAAGAETFIRVRAGGETGYIPLRDRSTASFPELSFRSDGTTYGVDADVSPDAGVFRLNYEDDSDTSTAIDSWDDAPYNGTISGATYDPDAHAGSFSLLFDATDDYVQMGDADAFTSDQLSVASWIKINNSGPHTIAAKAGGGGSREYIFQIRDDGSGNAVMYADVGDTNGDWAINYQSSVQIPIGKWTLVAYVIDNSNSEVRLYKNNNTPETVTYNGGGLKNTATSLFVGAQDGAGLRVTDGRLDVTDLYDRALTDSEVGSLYTPPTEATFSSLDHVTDADLSGDWIEEPAGTPVLTVSASGWDSDGVDNTKLLDEDGTVYAYYEGMSGTSEQIGVAFGSDLQNLSKSSSNPLIPEGGSGDFDEDGAKLPLPVKVDGTYYVFYSGLGSSGAYTIGYASASDPEGPFTKQGQILTTGGSGDFDEDSIFSFGLLEADGTYYLLYRGYPSGGGVNDAQLGIATASSIDGTWTKSNENPIIPSLNVFFTVPFSVDNSLYLWAGDKSDAEHRVYVATETDLTEWAQDGTVSTSWPWDNFGESESNAIIRGSEARILFEKDDRIHRAYTNLS